LWWSLLACVLNGGDGEPRCCLGDAPANVAAAEKHQPGSEQSSVYRVAVFSTTLGEHNGAVFKLTLQLNQYEIEIKIEIKIRIK
jgi:hypothetical protein